MQQLLALDVALAVLALIRRMSGIQVAHHVLWVQAFRVVYQMQLILIVASVLSVLYSMWTLISVNAYQAMVAMQRIAMLVVVFVEMAPLRARREIPSVLHVLLELKSQTMRPRPQAQTPVFVEEMLS